MMGIGAVRVFVVTSLVALGLGIGTSAQAASPITKKYNSLGGSSSFLGLPTGPEHDICNGRVGEYQGGNIYWSRATDAHEVHGDILGKLVSSNAMCPGGGFDAIGFPKTDERNGTAPVLRQSIFQRGIITWYGGGTARVISGRIYKKWRALGGGGVVGPATSDKASGGSNIAFQRFDVIGGNNWEIYEYGVIPDVTTRSIHGSILNKFRSGGGVGRYGVPLTDEKETPAHLGRYNDFAANTIVFNKRVGQSFVLSDEGSVGIRTEWVQHKRDRAWSGVPISDQENALVNGGQAKLNRFDGKPGTSGGVIIYGAYPNGTHPVFGGIFDDWNGDGREAGPLGFPIDDGEYRRGGRFQQFNGGGIYQSTAAGAVQVRGSHNARYVGEAGGPGGFLGWPTSETGPISDDVFTGQGALGTFFQHGGIVQTNWTGYPFFVTGPVGEKWIGESSAEHAETGYPRTDPFHGTQYFSTPTNGDAALFIRNPYRKQVFKIDNSHTGRGELDGLLDCYNHSSSGVPWTAGRYGYPISDETDGFVPHDNAHPGAAIEGAYFEATGHNGGHAYIYYWDTGAQWGCYWSIGKDPG